MGLLNLAGWQYCLRLTPPFYQHLTQHGPSPSKQMALPWRTIRPSSNEASGGLSGDDVNVNGRIDLFAANVGTLARKNDA